MHNVELLAPAKDLLDIKSVIESGADAVYISYRKDDEFWDDVKEGARFVHKNNKKIYVALNLVPHNKDIKHIEENLIKLEQYNIDAIIITDPGMLTITKSIVPNMEIHLSDQANTTNYITANFWYNQGVKRIIVSKELSCEEIGTIRVKSPIDMDIEAYVHGAMAISHSGRYLLSNFIKGKSENRVQASSEIRYNLVEEKRQGEFYPVCEDERGTFFFNSKELCMIEYIPNLIKCGITSFKIEGRLMDSKYTSEVVKAYRMAIDEFYKNPNEWTLDEKRLEYLKELSGREFTSGFYLDEPSSEE
ncbi:MAG: peptidase U32 family protein [Peptostreptococcaceae bacterium]